MNMSKSEITSLINKVLEEEVDDLSPNRYVALCKFVENVSQYHWWNKQFANEDYLSFIIRQVHWNLCHGVPIDKIPRGYRNNNPGNIRLTSSKWQGLCKEQKDGVFCQFVNLTYGFRAMLKLLDNYYLKHNCIDVRSIISRWAPVGDGNNTKAYINYVAENSGVTPAKPLLQPGVDKAFWVRFVIAMSEMESGLFSGYKKHELKVKASEAWNLLYSEDSL